MNFVGLKKVLLKNRIDINFHLSDQTLTERENEIKHLYHQNGFNSVNEKVLIFLSIFLDEELSFHDTVHFNLKNTLKCTYAIKAIESEFDLENILPFGMLYREHMILIIDANDIVYATMDNTLIHYGTDPIDALINIINHKKSTKINQ